MSAQTHHAVLWLSCVKGYELRQRVIVFSTKQKRLLPSTLTYECETTVL
jgi:hypothetical protein